MVSVPERINDYMAEGFSFDMACRLARQDMERDRQTKSKNDGDYNKRRDAIGGVAK